MVTSDDASESAYLCIVLLCASQHNVKYNNFTAELFGSVYTTAACNMSSRRVMRYSVCVM